MRKNNNFLKLWLKTLNDIELSKFYCIPRWWNLCLSNICENIELDSKSIPYEPNYFKNNFSNKQIILNISLTLCNEYQTKPTLGI